VGDSQLTVPALSALDRAIAKVAETECACLSADSTSEERAKLVECALESLDGLASRKRPAYNGWEALLYLTWYQPRQVHLAYSVLRRRFHDYYGPLRVVDLGCGAGAVQVALAILAAQAPFVGEISVRGIDRSRAMRRLGKKLWTAFLAEAMDSGLDRLSAVINAMNRSCSASDYPTWVASSDRRDEESVGGLSWLTAVHAVYEDNWVEFEELYYDVHDRVNPCYELVTSRTKGDLVRALVSQPRGGRLASDRAVPCWHGVVAKTTEWRRALADALGSPDGLTSRYLRNEVGWNKKPIGGDVVRERSRSQAR